MLVGADGRARVADFGLARQLAAAIETTAVDPPRLGASALDISLTMSGTVLGTPAYMAPEQLDGRPADARSDLFSFCVALFEALYGVRPYAGETLGALLNNLHQSKLSEVPASSQVPRRIAAALRRGLASDPRLRPASLEALLAELTYEPALRRRWGVFAKRPRARRQRRHLRLRRRHHRPGARPCSGGEAAIADLWSPTVARSLAADLADIIPSASARERATTGLDAYASGWVAARREACLAHHRGDDPAPARDARMRCLDRRRDALDGALRLLRDARPSDDIARVVAGLPALDACARIDALLVDPAAHRAPELAAAAAPHLRQLDQTRALADAGRIEEARAALRATYEAAIALPDRALHAQIGLACARLEMAAGDWPTAAAQLRLALADAVASDDHSAAAEAIARLLYARALTDQERPAAILADAPSPTPSSIASAQAASRAAASGATSPSCTSSPAIRSKSIAGSPAPSTTSPPSSTPIRSSPRTCSPPPPRSPATHSAAATPSTAQRPSSAASSATITPICWSSISTAGAPPSTSTKRPSTSRPRAPATADSPPIQAPMTIPPAPSAASYSATSRSSAAAPPSRSPATTTPPPATPDARPPPNNRPRSTAAASSPAPAPSCCAAAPPRPSPPRSATKSCSRPIFRRSAGGSISPASPPGWSSPRPTVNAATAPPPAPPSSRRTPPSSASKPSTATHSLATGAPAPPRSSPLTSRATTTPPPAIEPASSSSRRAPSTPHADQAAPPSSCPSTHGSTAIFADPRATGATAPTTPQPHQPDPERRRQPARVPAPAPLRQPHPPPLQPSHGTHVSGSHSDSDTAHVTGCPSQLASASFGSSSTGPSSAT
ncbi:MAG: protein kinase [Nannocystis sp.]|nr:protein kinase [Nannocystis sp.]